MNKKLFIFIILSCVLVLSGILVWYWWSGVQEPPEAVPDTSGSFGTTPGERETALSPTANAWRDIGAVQLRQITNLPVSGFVFGHGSSTNSMVYIEKQTGHIQEARLDSDVVRRLTNTTIPGSQETLWSKNNKVLFRFLDADNDTIRTFSASTTSSGDLEGIFLPNNLTTVAADPALERIFYLTQQDSGATGYIANTDGSKPQSIFSNVLKEWLVQWPNSQFIYLTTKPSALVAGALFSLNTKTGQIKILLSGLPGLTTLVNPQGTRVLYSFQGDNGVTEMGVYDMKNNGYRSLPIHSFPEKCVWKAAGTSVLCAVPHDDFRGTFPDAWYQGKYFFNDGFWSIDTVSGTTTKLALSEESELLGLDATNLTLSPDERYMGFINKRDLSLWGMSLNLSLDTASTAKSQ